MGTAAMQTVPLTYQLRPKFVPPVGIAQHLTSVYDRCNALYAGDHQDTVASAQMICPVLTAITSKDGS